MADLAELISESQGDKPAGYHTAGIDANVSTKKSTFEKGRSAEIIGRRVK